MMVVVEAVHSAMPTHAAVVVARMMADILLLFIKLKI